MILNENHQGDFEKQRNWLVNEENWLINRSLANNYIILANFRYILASNAIKLANFNGEMANLQKDLANKGIKTKNHIMFNQIGLNPYKEIHFYGKLLYIIKRMFW